MASTTEYWRESFWFTIAVWIFAQNIITSERNLKLSRPGLTDAEAAQKVTILEHWGPVRFFDVRVLLYTALLALPVWLFYPFEGTKVHDCLLIIALGAFMTPFALGSSLDPDVEDLRQPFWFIIKLFLSKGDAWLKTLLLVGVTSAIGIIPGVRHIARLYIRNVFGIVEGKQHELFQEFLGGTIAPLIVMLLIRLSVLGIYGLWRLPVFIASAAFVWINYQWFANESWARDPNTLFKVVGVAFLLDFVKDGILTLISGLASEPKEKR